MQVSKISSKGQITVPKLIRDILNLQEGDSVAFKIENGHIQVYKVDLEKVKQCII
ncbi:AbrB/MazE/SpoVT family DNA-binding domain-containing protein [Ammoniphilus resinae]|uniref:AbrB family looped-hinge helix DNA binding protein n=1 Tax=Ammoniphilus resinae TaxID=861532 RepID=A0ABS4GNQ3_9BACL|nr:AbrB/MazE/SpoVT family DNA-binding domain-containing protein [Ammoniphilus resinae]MBP1931905.1 AbrB family looped-hinge helix DNA binding protein [Ammoniphilus resinae]